MQRDLTPADLGASASEFTELRGTVKVADGLMTVRVEMIRGEIRNPFRVMQTLKDVARIAGAHRVVLEGNIANERLLKVISRYHAKTVRGIERIQLIVP